MSDTRKSPVSSDASTASKKPHSASGSLRPLAPKPLAPPTHQPLAIRVPTPLSSGTTVSRRRSPAACAVCYRIGCQLPTHTALTNPSRSSSGTSVDSRTLQTLHNDATYTSCYAYRIAQQYVDPDIAASKVDPFYDLPLDAAMNTPEIHSLFHSWFAVESQNCFRIPRPDGMVNDLVCGPFLLPAMQDSLLCLSVLAASAAGLPRYSGQQSGNVTTLTLLGQAIQQMRERIDSDPNHISDVTITAAVFLWIVNIFLEDKDAMLYHSGSIYAFVASRGGLHKLGMLGAIARFVRLVDSIHSLLLPLACHYPDSPQPGPPLKVASPRYGSYWLSDGPANISVNSSVATFCSETCRTLEQLEKAEEEGMSGAEYLRMLQCVDWLYTQGSVVRAESQNQGRINECIAVAVALIQFHSFSGFNKLLSVARTNVKRLSTAIKATGGPSFWQQDLDLLIWLLFVVVMVPVPVEENSWCLPFLCRVIVTRFGEQGTLKRSWTQDLHDSLRTFVWCDQRLEDCFENTCLAIRNEIRATDDDDSTSDEDD